VRIGRLPDAAWQGGWVSVAFGICDEPCVIGSPTLPGSARWRSNDRRARHQRRRPRIGDWGQHEGRFDSFVIDLPDEPAAPAGAAAAAGAGTRPPD
jgi:hypothetical protein